MIELANYVENINNIKENVATLRSSEKFKLISKSIETKLKILEDSLNLIYPHFRKKRGLLDIVGSGIKFITGNMDHYDAIEINNKIDVINSNNEQLIKNHNQQIEINHSMIDRFRNITIHINDQQKTIQNFLSTIDNKVVQMNKDAEHKLDYMQYVYQITFDIDTLLDHLKDIAECIKMAKLDIVSKNILSNTELNYVNDKLTNQSIHIDSLEQIYEHLKISAYYNHTNLLFVIKIPKFYPETFKEFLLEPIPNIENKSLDVPHDRILKGNKEAYFEIQKCYIVNKIKYCNLNELKNITDDKCFVNVLNNKKSMCNFNKIDHNNEIKQISKNYIIIKNSNHLNVKSNCNLNRNISGTALIKINNCSIEINGINYVSFNTIFNEDFFIIPLNKLDFKENTHYQQKINLETLKEFNIENGNKIEELHTISKINEPTQYSLILLLTATIIIFIVYIRVTNKKIFVTNTVPPLIVSSPESRLREGEVICPPKGTLRW